ncbi:hypothetical protein P4U05_16855 [Bacillus paranthracis]|uniref:hypothetical protein n=1 Tax=Bacillus paranthracis TaxID=2026186 RepID=UPI000200F43A|nr:hypothetical protein [Bacillus paranthracis]ADY20378.1 hypothetical protein YBT020_05660 [Bacillus thuringiensis serovar finitimus YBT-020]MRC72865.1 hypothetical protein [Bacillus thuringiensis]OTX71318.1 hypothetical protein BK722_12970 [Bacillus thuringiensis serovar finitimus]PGZ50237.1 hypothetical protein COE56_15130 [Bacillus anthracis]MCR6799346.1 hypothetical protein [Bacillus paranthracis]
MSHLLKFSLNSKMPIELIYMKSEQDFSQRRVIVRKIYEDRIVVYCMMRKQLRTLKLDKVLSVAKVEQERRYA